MEVTASHRQITVVEQSQISATRFAARLTADSAGFGAEDGYRAGLVATELASNLVKHARDGEVLVRLVGRAPSGEIELIAIDRGPGMPDISRSLLDGHSTAGTPGNGLGAVRRLADHFDIFSQVGRGSIVIARLRAGRTGQSRRHRIAVAGVSVPMSGEDVCGDAWQVQHQVDGALIAVVDGLGHGLQADEASNAAIAAIDPRRNGDLTAHLQSMHDALRHTRGAAGAMAHILPGKGVIKFAGIGNIAASICASAVRHAVSMNGTLGHEARQFREYSYPWEVGSVGVIHSDGLRSHWSIDDQPGLRQRDPAVIAALLYRDFNRQRDDVTVVVAKDAA
jgi:anti-sigma regulatory factor (Ser/Thr protein kinase)